MTHRSPDYEKGYADGFSDGANDERAGVQAVADALRVLLRDMETPRTRKASDAWDRAQAILAQWDGAA